jgi:hypothetical protein
MQENSDLKVKLSTEETHKNNLNQMIKQKNEKIDILKSELARFIGFFEKTVDEMKWSKDKLTQKEIQIKTYKERLGKLTNENEINLKLIDKLKKIKNMPEIKLEILPDFELIPVKPKPLEV